MEEKPGLLTSEGTGGKLRQRKIPSVSKRERITMEKKERNE